MKHLLLFKFRENIFLISRLPLTFLLFLSICFFVNAQGPGSPYVDAGEDVELECGEDCTELTADFLDTGESNQYEVSAIEYDTPYPFSGLANPVSVNTDDVWSNAINLPFDFCFFGDVYSQVTIGSNGIISFDVSQAGGYCSWVLNSNELIPNPSIHKNAIMLFHDINPAYGNNEVGWEMFGEAPNRAMVVSFYNVPYYYFANPNNGAVSTFQMVLYETTNAIEFFVATKPDPHDFIPGPINGGLAVLGIQNAAGNQGYTPPGRNTGVWSATEEAWRFLPSGESNVDFAWLDEDGEIIGTEKTITVCPTAEVSVYTARATWLNCNGDEVTVSDDVTVTKVASFDVDLGEDQEFCDREDYEITAELIDADPSEATFLWSTGETTQSIVVTETDTYSVEVSVGDCVITREVTIIFNETPEIDLGGDQALCDLSEYEITAEILNGDPLEATFLWSTGETTQSIVVTETDTYSVEVIIGDCVATKSVTIEFNKTPIIDLGEDITTCSNEPQVLDATPENFPDPSELTFEWSRNGTVLPNETEPTLEVFETGTYSVVVSDNECSATDSVVVTLVEMEVEVVMEGYESERDIEICPNEPRILKAISEAENVIYQWYLNGDELVGENEDRLEISLEAGIIGTQTYSVTIRFEDCEASADIDVRLFAVGNCVISQGLTPNGDGFNDNLDLTFLNVRTGIRKLQVFNRYGTKVYDKDNYVDQWRGQTNDGKELPTGTYFYVIDLAGDDPVYGRQTTGWIYLNQKAN